MLLQLFITSFKKKNKVLKLNFSFPIKLSYMFELIYADYIATLNCFRKNLLSVHFLINLNQLNAQIDLV
jgi:hypothetical protein